MGPPSEGRPSGDGRGAGAAAQAAREERQRRQQQQNSPSLDFHPQPSSDRKGKARAVEGPEGAASGSNGAPRGAFDTRDLAGALSPDDRAGSSSRDEQREKNRANGHGAGKSTGGSAKLCKKCDEPMIGQFVRALGGTFHIECFKCQDCGQIVASKFFPVDYEDGSGQYPLCETDYFRRLDLLCYECGGALRGSYITAIERKYHIEHFTCSVCPTVFGAQDSYYEHDGKVYCHYHYSTQFAQKCNGCQTAILKQFVEIFRYGETQFWHPECYMIHKFWNVRLAPAGQVPLERRVGEGLEASEERRRNKVREDEEHMEEKVFRIWSVLSTFEESSAACISDMLLHVSNGAYMDGVLVAKKFISHVDMLFNSLDRLDSLMTAQGMPGLSYGREAKLLCKKIVAFFQLLSKTQETGVRKLGVTQELLSLVTGLAHYLKLLIRISLQGALKLERERLNLDGLNRFLDDLGDLDPIKEAEKSGDLTTGVAGLAEQGSDLCFTCKNAIEDRCAKKDLKSWHLNCLSCSNCVRDLGPRLQDARWLESEQRVLCYSCAGQRQHAQGGFEYVTKLQQYVFLLRVALARLLSMLRAGGTLPHTSDDPNLATYDSKEGHRVSPTGQTSPPLLRSNTRSKSHTGTSEGQPESSYEQTLGDIRRLRSTRMDKHLSNTIRKARTSRIIDGPEGRRPGSAGADGSDMRNKEFHIVEERDVNGDTLPDLTFGNQDALTLDDIPRIVAAEQAKDQRPNAYKHARNQLLGSGGGQPKLINGHMRNVSGGNELDRQATGEQSPVRSKKYFSELTALEYFIVRHVAVLSLEPLIQGHMNLEELLDLIELRKPTFWGKFGKAFKNDGRKGGKKKGVFGVSLDALIERDGIESSYGVGPGVLRIPALIDDAVSAMRSMDMSVEGVFRKNGNIRRLKELADAIDTKGSNAVDLSRENPVQVAALLKKFLRELPDPLLTSKLHRLFITSSRIPDDEKRRRILHLTCCLLPKTHRDAMEVLFAFLNWTSSFSQVDEESGSKMDVHNLATVVTPNILYLNSKSSGMDESFLAIEAVNSLIECHQAMSEVPEDLQSILNDNSLFNGSADITTKEILKRYGDIGKTPTPQQPPATTDSPPPRSKDGRQAPAITRVNTDPHQASAWHMESSVRHVHGGSGRYGQDYPQHDDQSPLPQPHFNFNDDGSPYRSRAGSGGSQSSQGTPNQHSQHRNSGWGKQPGAVGVTGA